ncbi:hypothetical protein BOW52_07110 [Solemya elarraichensis gill symbiont]|uniref:Uncharacterized protein n=1 Tax=Solemya elarraichensis gill symbiont TaxID=1918949 RepID=A0A1T2L3K5_9GAMM|nr:hypothetical protein BOW52_07110 [Solemya elarraichensis gill symbiont]
MSRIGDVFRFLYGPPLRFLAWIAETYTSNRNRVTSLKENPRVAGLIRNAAIIILLLWALIWIFAPDEYRERLTEEFKTQIEKYNADSQDSPAQTPAQQESQPAATQSLQTDQERR